MKPLLALLLLATPALADTHVSIFVRERQQAMRDMAGALTALEVLASGATPYDPALAAARAADIAEATGSLEGAFEDTPASRFGATSRATDTVWTAAADFLARMEAFRGNTFALIDAARAGPPALLPALADLRAGCDGCHATYLKPPR